MSEGGPPAEIDGWAVQPPDVGPSSPADGVEAPAIPPTLILGYLDLALRGAQEYERYASLYLSPWWELPNLPDGVAGWKRAVLERVPLRGAIHWGHLYLVVRDALPRPSRLAIFGRRWQGGVTPVHQNETRLAIRRGQQLAEIVLHPSRSDRAETLAQFGREVEIRFRRQMD